MAVSYPGTSGNYVRRAGDNPYSASGFTLAGWVRPASLTGGTWQNIFYIGISGRDYGLQWNGTLLNVWGPSFNDDSPGGYSAATWYFVAWVYDDTANVMRGYIGTETGAVSEVCTASGDQTPKPVGTDPFNVGAWQSNFDIPSNGTRFAHVRAWTVPLTAVEVEAERLASAAVKTANLWGDWGLVSASLADASGNARNLAMVGTVTSADGPNLVPAQYARPDSDAENTGNWIRSDNGSTANTYQMVDEAARDDGDYARSPASPSAAVVRWSLGNPTPPTVDTEHVLRYAYRKEAAGNQINLSFMLQQGGSQIEAWTEMDIPAAWTLQARTLASLNVANITDYADLIVRVSASEVAPASPSYVGSGAAVFTATSGAALNPQAPTHNVGDLGVLVAHTSSNVDLGDTITGWSKLVSVENNTTAQRVEIWWRTMDGGANDNPSIAGIASTAVRGARVFCVRGVLAQAPTLQRANNAASATVTFPNATAAAAGSLSVLAYAYEDDPNAIGTVSGFSAFSVNGSTLGTDAAIGADASRVNPASGTVNGGTATVSGGSFANSPNVGLHFVFEPLTNTPARANVSWVELQLPGVASADGLFGGAIAVANAASPVAALMASVALLAELAQASTLAQAADTFGGAALVAEPAQASIVSPVATLIGGGGIDITYPAEVSISNTAASAATLTGGAALAGGIAQASAGASAASLLAGALLAAELAQASTLAQAASLLAGAQFGAQAATASAASPAATLLAAAALLANVATVSAQSQSADVLAAALFAANPAQSSADALQASLSAGSSLAGTLLAGVATVAVGAAEAALRASSLFVAEPAHASIASPAAVLAVYATLAASVAQVSAQSLAADARAGAILAANAAAADAAALAATLSAGSSIPGALAAMVAQATAQSLAASLIGGASLVAGPGQATAQSLAASLIASAALAGSPGGASAQSLAAGLSGVAAFLASVAQASTAALAATLSAGSSIPGALGAALAQASAQSPAASLYGTASLVAGVAGATVIAPVAVLGGSALFAATVAPVSVDATVAAMIAAALADAGIAVVYADSLAAAFDAGGVLFAGVAAASVRSYVAILPDPLVPGDAGRYADGIGSPKLIAVLAPTGGGATFADGLGGSGNARVGREGRYRVRI